MDFLFRITLAIAQMMKLSLVALRMGIIFWLTNDNDNESVKDQDNQVSRPNSPLQPNVSIEPSVSLTDGNQKEPRNVQKVDEGSDNDNCYSCDMCDTSFSVKTNMLTHKKTNHSIYQCEMCDECFSKKSALTKHFNSCHLQCPHSLCNLNLKNRFTLNRHINSKHKQIVYPCDECKSTFTREDTLQRHIESVQQKCVISMWRMQIYIHSKN